MHTLNLKLTVKSAKTCVPRSNNRSSNDIFSRNNITKNNNDIIIITLLHSNRKRNIYIR